MFDATLWGKFRKHLDGLCARLVVYSFNGAGYDHVLLLSRLACFANTPAHPSTRFHVVRAGNRIRSISFDKGIRFSDAQHLVSAGSSLRRLAQMVGLPDDDDAFTKGKFPFAAFTSHAFLRQRELPGDAASWYNTLRDEPTPEADIRACLDDYKAGGYPNVGAYLHHYLKS